MDPWPDDPLSVHYRDSTPLLGFLASVLLVPMLMLLGLCVWLNCEPRRWPYRWVLAASGWLSERQWRD